MPQMSMVRMLPAAAASITDPAAIFSPLAENSQAEIPFLR